MVGPGTGLAPFRGFLQERAALRARDGPVGPSLLFFGCRHPRQDFIYEDELRGFAEQGVARLFACFSRLADEQKTYVQDQVLRQRAEVWQLLQAGAVVYVCGDASRMAPDVRRAFAAIHRQETGRDERAAERWLDELTAREPLPGRRLGRELSPASQNSPAAGGSRRGRRPRGRPPRCRSPGCTGGRRPRAPR